MDTIAPTLELTTTAPAVDPATGEIIEPAAAPTASEATITAMLTLYGDLKAKLTLLQMDLAAREQEILKPVAAALAEAQAQYHEQADGIEATLIELDTRIEASVLALGRKVIGNGWQAVHTNGRVLWNDKALLRLAAANPAIMACRSYGKASVSIRVAKEAPAAPAAQTVEA